LEACFAGWLKLPVTVGSISYGLPNFAIKYFILGCFFDA
jgi:hypothetical protein